MNFYLDTEFLEGTQKRKFLGFNIGETKPTIDLISIGIVCEDGREYYAISKDFNLKEVWNRVQVTTHSDEAPQYWHRNNVLFPIYNSFISGDMKNRYPFTLDTMKWLVAQKGISNTDIAEEICSFIFGQDVDINGSILSTARKYQISDKTKNPIFYGYYSAYDWVVFCQLHGIMMDLPKGYPFYCIDLKQTFDEISLVKCGNSNNVRNYQLAVKNQSDFPKQKNEHHALYDARWIKDFHGFLFSLR